MTTEISCFLKENETIGDFFAGTAGLKKRALLFLAASVFLF